MPKAELHCAFRGTLEPELSWRFRNRNGIKLPHYTNPRAVKAATSSRLTRSSRLLRGMSVLVNRSMILRLTWAIFAKARRRRGLCRMFFDPQAIPARGVAFGHIIAASAGPSSTPRSGRHPLRSILAQRTGGGVRDENAGPVACPDKDWISASASISDERATRPRSRQGTFARARDEGIPSPMQLRTSTAGFGRPHLAVVREIGAGRIDHGVQLAGGREALTGDQSARGLGLTVCRSHAYVTDGTKAAAIRTMIDKGKRVTVKFRTTRLFSLPT